MITSKLSAKAQTTIPEAVRSARRLQAGDEIVYVVDGQSVTISKAKLALKDDPFATFEEWGSEADQKAYGAL